MTNFAKYLQTVVEKTGEVDLVGLTYTVNVSVPQEGKTFTFKVGANHTVAQLSEKLREKSEKEQLKKPITVNLASVAFKTKTKLSKIFSEEKVEFQVVDNPKKNAYQAILKL